MTITDLNGQSWKYEYQQTIDPASFEIIDNEMADVIRRDNQQGRPLLTKVIDPLDHVVEEQKYDDAGYGCVIEQRNGAGEKTLGIEYPADNPNGCDPLGVRRVIVAEGGANDPNQSITYIFNGSTLTSTEFHYDGALQTTTRQPIQNGVEYTDANGHKTTQLLSGKGLYQNLVEVKNGDNNSVVRYEYNDGAADPAAPYNNLTTITDGLSHPTRFEYGHAVFPTLPSAVVDAEGNRTTFDYTPEGYLEKETRVISDTVQSQEIVTFHVYGAFSQRIRTVVNYVAQTGFGPGNVPFDPQHPDQNIKTDFAYDDMGRLVKITDTYGRINRIVYDNVGRVLRTIRNCVPQSTCADTSTAFNPTLISYDPAHPDQNIVTVLEYDDAGRLTTQKETVNATAEGVTAYRVTTFTYDDANRLRSVTTTLNGQPITTLYAYDTAGNLIAATDPLDRTARMCYDQFGRLTRQIQNFQPGQHSGQDPCALARPDFLADADKDAMTDFTYDPVGNLIQVVDPLERVTQYCYDANNRRTLSVFNPFNPDQDNCVDPGSPTSATQNLVTRFAYNTLGQAIYSRGSDGVATYTCYDELNRPTRTIVRPSTWPVDGAPEDTTAQLCSLAPTDPSLADALVSSIVYNSLGQATNSTDPLGTVTQYEYDSLGRPTKTIANFVENGAETASQNITREWRYGAVQYGDYRLETVDILDQLVMPELNATPTTITTTVLYDAVGRVRQNIYNHTSGDFEPATQLFNVSLSFSAGANLATTYTYDGLGQVLTATDYLGRITKYTYDELGNRTLAIQNFVSADGAIPADPFSLYDPGHPDQNLVTRMAYDDAGRLEAITDTLQIQTTFELDDADRLTRLIQNNVGGPFNMAVPEKNVTTEFGYDKAGNRLWVNHPPSPIQGNINFRRVDWTCYDALNRPLYTVLNAAGGLAAQPCAGAFTPSTAFDQDIITMFAYDSSGNLGDVYETADLQIDPADVRTHFDYDGLNRRIRTVLNYKNGDHESNSLPNEDVITSVAYDKLGNVLTQTDPAGNSTMLCYDALNRLTRQVVNTTSTTPEVVCSEGFQPTDPTSHDRDIVTRFIYDSFGRIHEQIDPRERRSIFQYDLLGRLTKRVLNYNNGLVSDGPADEDVTQLIAYDVVDGQALQTTLTEFTHPADLIIRQTQIDYDRLDRQIAITLNYKDGVAPSSDVNVLTKTGYDGLGRILTQQDPNAFVTHYQYDALGRLLEVKVPLSGDQTLFQLTKTAYDGVGNIREVEDSLSQTTKFEYDGLFRQTAVISPLGFRTSTDYQDKLGRVIHQTDANGTIKGAVTRLEYDALNRLTKVIENYKAGLGNGERFDTNVTTSYVYDVLGQLKVAELPVADIHYDYDALGRRKEINGQIPDVSAGSNDVWTMVYDKAGRPESATDPNGIVKDFTFDNLDRLTKIDYPVTNATTDTTHAVDFTYDGALGRIKTMTDGWGATIYDYDALDRLTSVADPRGQTVSYQYDAGGRRTQMTWLDGKRVNYFYDGPERLKYLTDWDPATALPNAAALGLPAEADVAYAYNDLNLVSEMHLPNGVKAKFKYDKDNRLTGLVYTNGGQTLFEVAYDLDKVGNRVAAYEAFGQPLDRTFDDNGEAGSANWNPSGSWGLSNEASYSGAMAYSDSPGGNYAPDSDTALTLAQSIALPANQAAVLTYQDPTDIAAGDHGYVEVSTDNGQTWTVVQDLTDVHQPEWVKQAVDLSAYAGQSILIRFHLVANGDAETGDGWHIDDIQISTSDTSPPPTPTSEPTNTPTPLPTDTPTSAPTDTPTATATDTATATPTDTATATPSNTPTPTDTDTPTATATATFTPSNTATPSNTPTPTATATDTPTPTDTFTPSNTPTNTFTPSNTPTPTDTDTPTATATFTPSNTPTPTDTFTPSNTPTPTETDTPTATVTFTPSNTPTPTNTLTPSNTPTPTDTDTPTATATFTPSNTPTPTDTLTPSNTPTATNTDTPTSTATFTATETASNTPTATATFTPSNTPAPTTLTAQVAASSDDVNQDGTSLSTTSSTVWLGNSSSTTSSYTGLRFTNLTIPQGATITSAHLEVFSSSSQWITISFTIAAEATGNSPTFSTANKPSQRMLTAQQVSHSSNVQWQASTWYSLNEMGPVIQEVVSRADWQSGNSLSVILKGTGSAWGKKSVASYNGSALYAPRLVITYTTGGGPTNTPTATPSNTPTATATFTPTSTPPGALGDDFNRANSTNLGALWTERDGDWQIVANTLRNLSTGGELTATFNDGPFANVVVTSQMQIASAYGATSIGARWSFDAEGYVTGGYEAELTGSGNVILWRAGYSYTQLGSYQIPGYQPGQWVTLALRADGSNLSVGVDGVTRITATDSTFTSGQAGVWAYASAVPGEHRFDNFSIQVITGGNQGSGGAKAFAAPVVHKLDLTATCSAAPALFRQWRVRNPNAFAIPYTAVLDTPFRQTVTGTVPPAEHGQPGVTFFVTAAQSRENKVELYANGRWQDLEASSGTQCNSAREAFTAYDLPAANPGAFAPEALTGTPPSFQHTIKYDYDGLYRLTSANYCGGYVTDCPAPAAYRAYGYAYDLMGNRTQAQAWQGAANVTSHFTYDYSFANQLTASTNMLAGQTTGYKYDLAGRLIAYGAVSQSPDYTDVTLGWDAENRLTSYSDQSSVTTYQYTGYGDRYQQTVNGVATDYLLDYNTSLTQVLAETTNSQTTTYLTGVGQQTSAGWQYFNTDGLGSVRQLTDAAGAVTYRTNYEPYGTPFEQWPNPQAASAFGYTGEQTDANSLVYLRARYYDPRLGTFLSRDPFEGVRTSAMSQNGYSYAHGNPVRYTDPSGQICFDPITFIPCAIVGGAFLLGTTFAAWDVFTTQGVGVGGHNQGNMGAVNWGQTGGAALRGAGIGAIAGGVVGCTVAFAVCAGAATSAWQFAYNRILWPAAIAAMPYYLQAMQFFQTPWGQRTGNFLEGVTEECVDGCKPAEALAGGVQEALFGEMLEGFPGLRRNPASSNDLFTPDEYQVFRGALDDFAAGRRNLQQVTPEEDALIRRAILREHPQYLEEIQGSLNQLLDRSVFGAVEEFGPEFEPGMRIRDAGNVILDYLDYTEKPEAAHTLSMAEAYDYYQKGEIEGFDEFGFGERLFNRTYEQVKAAGTLGVDQTAKGDYGLRIVRSSGRIMAVVSDYDIGYVKTGGRFLYTIEGSSDRKVIRRFITRVNSNYGRNILQHPEHYTGMLEGLEGATVGRALSGEIMIYRYGETAPIIEHGLARVLYKSLGANNIWQFSKLLSEQVPNTTSPFFRAAWYEMLENADRITSPP